jgi:Patatin-like phospholipase
MRQILSIDGGGIKGAFPASFLATIEDSIGRPVADYFDLIAGTSTGGIIALGLGLGLGARRLLEFYESYGPKIFERRGAFRRFRSILRAKYDSAPLKQSLEQVFQGSRLGESTRRLIIPSLNIETGEVHIWKTAHSQRFERDYQSTCVEVAMATAAAPAYFPTYRSRTGTPLIDGGVWANNPVAIAAVEAIGVLGWSPANIRILSIGCTTTPLAFDWGRSHSLGTLGWARGIVDTFMVAQSQSANGMVQHLLPDRENILRINPAVPKDRFGLDDTSDIPSLKGLGDFEARKALPTLRLQFFQEPAENDFEPFHKL